MAMMVTSTISWFGILALAALLYVVVRGLANHHTRPYLIWLAVLPGLLVLFFAFSRQLTVRVQERPSVGEFARLLPRSGTTSRVAPETIESAPTPSKTSPAAETKRPKMTLIAALRQAVVRSLKP